MSEIHGGTATADRPTPRPAAGGQGARRGPLGRIALFYRQVVAELRKVVWPTRREAANLTLLVIALSMAMGVLLGGVDFLFQQLFRLIVGA